MERVKLRRASYLTSSTSGKWITQCERFFVMRHLDKSRGWYLCPRYPELKIPDDDERREIYRLLDIYRLFGPLGEDHFATRRELLARLEMALTELEK